MNADLTKRVDHFRADYAAVCGQPSEHFYCPILLRDEPAVLCRGHVLAGGLGNSGAWVPQREDVDNLFGRAFEAGAIHAIKDRKLSPFEVWANSETNRVHRPRLEVNGEIVDHYFPQTDHTPTGQTRLAIMREDEHGVSTVGNVIA